jgi:putative hydrolase of HD superfamily
MSNAQPDPPGFSARKPPLAPQPNLQPPARGMRIPSPPLLGPRLQLRDLRLDDLSTFRHWRMPGHEWQRFDGPYYGPDTPAEVDTMIERWRRRIQEAHPKPEPRTRLAICRRADDRMIGTVSWYWEMKECWWPAAGISIFDPAHWNSGLGFEALGLWIDYLFAAQPRFARMDLHTWSGNPRMGRLAEKLGFQLEARYRRAVFVGEERFDSLGFGVLREEWAAQYARGFAASLGGSGTIAG